MAQFAGTSPSWTAKSYAAGTGCSAVIPASRGQLARSSVTALANTFGITATGRRG